MASHDEWAGSGSIDPAFAELFRAEGAPAVPAPGSVVESDGPESDPLGVEPAAAMSEPAQDEPPVVESPRVSETSVDTGRLFRSQGVSGPSTAVLALSSDHGGRLKTLTRSDVPPPPVAPTPLSSPQDMFVDQGPASDASGSEHPVPSSDTARRSRRGATTADGLTAGGVYLLIIGVTLIVGLINVLLAGGKISWPTGIALLAVTIFCALKVRRDDDTVVIITPPIAFFLAAITVGQISLGSTSGSLLNRAVVTFFTLADNWIWIIGATVAAAVIVVVRRRR